MPYSASSSGSSNNGCNSLPGRSYASTNENFNQTGGVTTNYVTEAIRNAHAYKLQRQQHNPAVTIQRIQARTFIQPHIATPNFSCYREKVIVFTCEITKAHAERTINRGRYEEYKQRYSAALLQSYEDEFHLKHCRVPCARCVEMAKNYVSAIY